MSVAFNGLLDEVRLVVALRPFAFTTYPQPRVGVYIRGDIGTSSTPKRVDALGRPRPTNDDEPSTQHTRYTQPNQSTLGQHSPLSGNIGTKRGEARRGEAREDVDTCLSSIRQAIP